MAEVKKISGVKKRWIYALTLCILLCTIASPVIAAEEKIQIDGIKGKVTVNDIFERWTDSSKRVHIVRTEIIDNDKFSIEYYPPLNANPDDLEFSINVKGKTVKQKQDNQREAESYLINALGVDKKTTCNLPVTILAPANTKSIILNEFSFCQGGGLIK